MSVPPLLQWLFQIGKLSVPPPESTEFLHICMRLSISNITLDTYRCVCCPPPTFRSEGITETYTYLSTYMIICTYEFAITECVCPPPPLLLESNR